MSKSKLRNVEMCRFENFLWRHHNPAECLEDFAEQTTKSLFWLSVITELDPTEIVLPLSPTVLSYVRHAHEFFRTPVDERGVNEIEREFYPGAALSEEELRWVALHIQSAIIPAD
ncbi:MAG: hypothetical protein NC418_04465 [Muribaculaceae bacterium]|nr:hypothetical protein [Muribaculaceae bacterium]MCM1225427.1 hypothetical protein [Lachnospiraceae bacterium]